MNFQSIDLVAIVGIICCTILLYTGHDGAVVSFLATIIGWYFGRKQGESKST